MNIEAEQPLRKSLPFQEEPIITSAAPPRLRPSRKSFGTLENNGIHNIVKKDDQNQAKNIIQYSDSVVRSTISSKSDHSLLVNSRPFEDNIHETHELNVVSTKSESLASNHFKKLENASSFHTTVTAFSSAEIILGKKPPNQNIESTIDEEYIWESCDSMNFPDESKSGSTSKFDFEVGNMDVTTDNNERTENPPEAINDSEYLFSRAEDNDNTLYYHDDTSNSLGHVNSLSNTKSGDELMSNQVAKLTRPSEHIPPTLRRACEKFKYTYNVGRRAICIDNTPGENEAFNYGQDGHAYKHGVLKVRGVVNKDKITITNTKKLSPNGKPARNVAVGQPAVFKECHSANSDMSSSITIQESAKTKEVGTVPMASKPGQHQKPDINFSKTQDTAHRTVPTASEARQDEKSDSTSSKTQETAHGSVPMTSEPGQHDKPDSTYSKTQDTAHRKEDRTVPTATESGQHDKSDSADSKTQDTAHRTVPTASESGQHHKSDSTYSISRETAYGRDERTVPMTPEAVQYSSVGMENKPHVSENYNDDQCTMNRNADSSKTRNQNQGASKSSAKEREKQVNSVESPRFKSTNALQTPRESSYLNGQRKDRNATENSSLESGEISEGRHFFADNESRSQPISRSIRQPSKYSPCEACGRGDHFFDDCDFIREDHPDVNRDRHVPFLESEIGRQYQRQTKRVNLSKLIFVESNLRTFQKDSAYSPPDDDKRAVRRRMNNAAVGDVEDGNCKGRSVLLTDPATEHSYNDLSFQKPCTACGQNSHVFRVCKFVGSNHPDINLNRGISFLDSESGKRYFAATGKPTLIHYSRGQIGKRNRSDDAENQLGNKPNESSRILSTDVVVSENTRSGCKLSPRVSVPAGCNACGHTSHAYTSCRFIDQHPNANTNQNIPFVESANGKMYFERFGKKSLAWHEKFDEFASPSNKRKRDENEEETPIAKDGGCTACGMRSHSFTECRFVKRKHPNINLDRSVYFMESAVGKFYFEKTGMDHLGKTILFFDESRNIDSISPRNRPTERDDRHVSRVKNRTEDALLEPRSKYRDEKKASNSKSSRDVESTSSSPTIKPAVVKTSANTACGHKESLQSDATRDDNSNDCSSNNKQSKMEISSSSNSNSESKSKQDEEFLFSFDDFKKLQLQKEALKILLMSKNLYSRIATGCFIRAMVDEKVLILRFFHPYDRTVHYKTRVEAGEVSIDATLDRIQLHVQVCSTDSEITIGLQDVSSDTITESEYLEWMKTASAVVKSTYCPSYVRSKTASMVHWNQMVLLQS